MVICFIFACSYTHIADWYGHRVALNYSWQICIQANNHESFPLKDFTMYGISHQQIFVPHRFPKSTLHSCISDRLRCGTRSIPDLFPEAPWSLYWAIEWSPTISIQLAGKHWSIASKHWGSQVIKWCSTINNELASKILKQHPTLNVEILYL